MATMQLSLPMVRQVLSVRHGVVNNTEDGWIFDGLAWNAGTGKTFTMQGDTDEQAGVMPRVFSRIFDAIHQSSDVEYLIRVSYLELYNEEIRDLFDKNSNSRLELKENRENSVYVKNLRTVVVENATDMMKVLKVRATGTHTSILMTSTRSCRSVQRIDLWARH